MPLTGLKDEGRPASQPASQVPGTQELLSTGLRSITVTMMSRPWFSSGPEQLECDGGAQTQHGTSGTPFCRTS